MQAVKDSSASQRKPSKTSRITFEGPWPQLPDTPRFNHSSPAKQLVKLKAPLLDEAGAAFWM